MPRIDHERAGAHPQSAQGRDDRLEFLAAIDGQKTHDVLEDGRRSRRLRHLKPMKLSCFD
jgi:hypothetical protein